MTLRLVVVGAFALMASGCAQTFFRGESLTEPVAVLAVLPIERLPDVPTENLAPEAERVVTAHVYGVLADTSRFRVVPDATVADALRKLSPGIGSKAKARALGQTVGADAVLYGSVARFVEREGSAAGSDAPASVAIRLGLLSAATGELLWESEFNETQQALTTNLFNYWQFFRAGPRWFTVSEYARLGVERMLEDLERRAK